MRSMNTSEAIKRAGGRDKLAELLGVSALTTYGPTWKPNLPPKHERFLRAKRPRWFRVTQ